MALKLILLWALNVCIFVNALQIYQYKTSLVSLKVGNGWIIDGNFKLIHIINLEEYMEITMNISTSVQKHIPPSRNKGFILHHLSQMQERLSELIDVKKRSARSIDWIGSAWKWIAGNPDASDWNTILRSQENIIENNNEQYKINKELQQISNQTVRRVNEMIARLNNITSGKDHNIIEQNTMNEIIILKDEINEIVRACQMAKNGIVNTNLLDQPEINRIIDELETLPYSNVIEAVEYGTPSVYTNGSHLLYTLSMPKLGRSVYNLLLTRAAINEGRQIDLQFEKVLINEAEAYGIKDNCLSINNSTICKRSSVIKLAEDDCINRILKGGSAKCRYKFSQEEVVEALNDDVVYVTNFEGEVKANGESKFLKGTYLLQLLNESIIIKNRTYSSGSVTNTQALPPVLANVIHDDLLPDIKYVHEVSVNNINRLDRLGAKVDNSIGINVTLIVAILACIAWIWYQQTKKLNLPRVQFQVSTTAPMVSGTQTFKEGGVRNSGSPPVEANFAA